MIVVTNKNGVVESVTFGDDVKEENSEKSELTATITWPTSEDAVLDDKCSEYVTVPFIALYDGVYTYKSINENGTVSIKETWIKDAN